MQAGREAELYGQEDVHCVLTQASRQKTVHSVQCAGRPWGIAGRQKVYMASMQEGVRTLGRQEALNGKRKAFWAKNLAAVT